MFKNLQSMTIYLLIQDHGAEVRNHAAILDRLPVGYARALHDIDYPWPRPQPDWDEDSLVNNTS